MRNLVSDKSMLENGIIGLKDRNDPVIPYLEAAQSIIIFNNYLNKPYLNSNQNWKAVDEIDLSNVKKAYTILSSGESIVQLLKNDILDIKAVDNNPLQKPIFCLRKAAFKVLSPNEFESFLLYRDGYQYLSDDIYKHVKEAFDKDEDTEKRFWELMLAATEREDLTNLFKGGFESVPIDIARSSLSYLKKKKEYYKIRENFEKANIKIEIGDVFDLLEKSNSVDFIDISNVLLTQNQLLSNEEMMKLYDRLKNIYNEKLNSNGVFLLDYFYATDTSSILSEPETEIKKEARKIYINTYKHLQEQFDIETVHPAAIPNATPLKGPKDTLVYTLKK